MLVVLEEGQVADTLLYAASNLLGHFPPVVAVLLLCFCSSSSSALR